MLLGSKPILIKLQLDPYYILITYDKIEIWIMPDISYCIYSIC